MHRMSPLTAECRSRVTQEEELDMLVSDCEAPAVACGEKQAMASRMLVLAARMLALVSGRERTD